MPELPVVAVAEEVAEEEVEVVQAVQVVVLEVEEEEPLPDLVEEKLELCSS